MMILAFPTDIHPTSCDWRLVPRTMVFSNPFNGTRQTMSLPGAYWQAQLSFSNLSRDKGAELHALVSQLRGPSGRIQLWDHAFASPRGLAGGNAVVNGANQLGGQLNISGVTPSMRFLRLGDYCQIANQLVILTRDAMADSLGNCLLTFEAPLRYAPVNGSPIITQQASAVMMLKDDNQGGRRSSKRLVLSGLTLTFIEDVSQ